MQSINTFTHNSEIDFHKFKKLDHFDIEKKLIEFLEDNYLIGNKYLLVITGKGKLVKPIVKNLLLKNKFVNSFKAAGYFNGQDGAFEVVLNL